MSASDETLASCIEHTLLRPDATQADVEQALEDAIEWGCHGVCVQPHWVRTLSEKLTGLPIVTVIGFPFGTIPPAIKAAGIHRACDDGATEIDAVLNIGALKSGDWLALEHDLRTVRHAAEDVVLKIIFETGYMTAEERERVAFLCGELGVDFLKTSTGYGPRGATIEDVEALSQLGAVKASGGIRTREQAEAMVAAGARRLGTSASGEILKVSPS